MRIVLFMLLTFIVSCSGLRRAEQPDDLADKVGESTFAETEKQNQADDSSTKMEDEFSSDVDDSAGGSSSRLIRDDLRGLSEAKKRKSETEMLNAASQILNKDPNNIEALNSLAVLYFEQKKYGIAKIILKRALKSHPNSPTLHNNLAIIYLAEEDLPLALDSFKKSISVKGNYKIGATNLSSIYLEYRDYKRSLAPLENAYRAMRSDIGRGSAVAVDVANNYAVALIGVGENDKASKVFAEIDAAGTRNPVPYLNYAILLVDVLNKKKDAVRIISKLKFMTEDKDILRRVGQLEGKQE